MPNDMYSMNKEITSTNDRQIKMLVRRLVGTRKYLQFLRSNGGWVDCEQYGQIIGLRKEQVEQRVASFELVSVCIDGEVCVPLFQYDECRQDELYGLSSINKVLLDTQQLGNSSASSWWLSGAKPRRSVLMGDEDLTIAYERLMVQARLAGEMGR